MTTAMSLMSVALFASAVAFAAPASAEPRDYVVDTSHSKLMVNVFRSGAFSPALHDHHFAATQWNGRTTFDPARPGETRATLTVQAGSLRDQESSLSEKDLAKVNAQVRGPDVLDAAKYPEIRFELTRLDLDPSSTNVEQGVLHGKLVGNLSIHGQTRRATIPVAAKWSNDVLAVNGKIAFLQSDFGIKPYRKLGGAIGVKDAVEVEIALRANPVVSK